jgi:predicted phosphodiesterase
MARNKNVTFGIDIAKEYREKWGWDMPTLTLAKVMYKENPTQFKNVDAARSALRYIEGKAGQPAKNNTMIVRGDIPERPRNPYKLPESYAVKRKPFKLPMACNNILFISDLHIPYHDIKAVTVALDYGVREKINTVFINGDLMDFHKKSKFQHDPRKRSTVQEFDACKEFLRILRATFPDASIYWLKGNHDVRYEHWLMAKAPELFGDPYYQLENRLRLNEERVTLLDDATHVKIGKLSVTHGHHVMRGFFAPVNSARGAWNKAKQSLIISHVHKVSTHTETNMNGDVFVNYSTGCLCEIKPDYSPLVANYQHGFARITVEPNGDYHVQNFQIINGKLY